MSVYQFDAEGRPLKDGKPVSKPVVMRRTDVCTVEMAVEIAKGVVKAERWHRRFLRWLARARLPTDPTEQERGGLYR